MRRTRHNNKKKKQTWTSGCIWHRKTSPKNRRISGAYTHAVVFQRSGTDSGGSRKEASMRTTSWPGPLWMIYLGERDFPEREGWCMVQTFSSWQRLQCCANNTAPRLTKRQMNAVYINTEPHTDGHGSSFFRHESLLFALRSFCLDPILREAPRTCSPRRERPEDAQN